jgi:endoribonuclease Nob1
MKVLDSSAIIHSDNDFTEGGFVTTNSVLSELISDTVRLVLEQALREGFITVRDPKKEYVEKVKNAAKETGDLQSLSATDIGILALSLETGGVLWSDDYAAQNVAKKIGVKYKPTAKEGIKNELVWQKACTACGRKYSLEKTVCDVCGTSLKKKATHSRK